MTVLLKASSNLPEPTLLFRVSWGISECACVCVCVCAWRREWVSECLLEPLPSRRGVVRSNQTPPLVEEGPNFKTRKILGRNRNKPRLPLLASTSRNLPDRTQLFPEILVNIILPQPMSPNCLISWDFDENIYELISSAHAYYTSCPYYFPSCNGLNIFAVIFPVFLNFLLNRWNYSLQCFVLYINLLIFL
jgi:hypothetical protein